MLAPNKNSRLGLYLARYMTPTAQAARLAGDLTADFAAWYHFAHGIAGGLALVLVAWSLGWCFADNTTPRALLTSHGNLGRISQIGTCAMKSAPSLPGYEATDFAKAMTKHEFGRFYWDDSRQDEVRRSLARAMARIKEERRARAKLEKRKK